jgi:hypothetical protein
MSAFSGKALRTENRYGRLLPVVKLACRETARVAGEKRALPKSSWKATSSVEPAVQKKEQMRRHYHVIQSHYGDPCDQGFRSLREVRKAIQSVLKDYRRDDGWRIQGNGSGLWYELTPTEENIQADHHFLTFDECADAACFATEGTSGNMDSTNDSE